MGRGKKHEMRQGSHDTAKGKGVVDHMQMVEHPGIEDANIHECHAIHERNGSNGHSPEA